MYLLFIIILFTLCIAYIVKVRCSHLCTTVLKLPACLRELPIFGSCFELIGSPEDSMRKILRVSRNTSELGGAARICLLNVFCITFTDASDIHEVLNIYLDKGYVYRFLQMGTGNGSVFAPAAAAKVRRKITTPSFSPRTLNGFVGFFWEESVKLTEVLASHAGTGPFSVEEYLNAWSFHTVIRTMGVKEIDQVFHTREFLNTLNKSFEIVLERATSVWLYPDFMFRFSSAYTKAQQCIKILYYNANKILMNRRNYLKDNNVAQPTTDSNKVQGMTESISDCLLKSNLSDHEISEELLVIIGATDTTSISVGFTLMLLGQYPSVQDNVYKELQDVFCNSDRPLVKDDLNKLNYLDLVIKESLRLFPPAPVITRKAHKDATLSSGRLIPAGAEIVTSIVGLHRNPKYWGPDAEHFDPDRFLPEQFEKVHPNAYIPFSSGSRNCVGYKYGQMAMKAALSTILRKYKIVGEPAQGPIPNIRTKFEMLFKTVNNFKIEIVNRNE